MDVCDPGDEVLVQVKKECGTGDYRVIAAVLKEKLSPHQECQAVTYLSCCYRALYDFKAALPHVQRLVVLAQHRSRPGVGGLCMVQAGLKAPCGAKGHFGSPGHPGWACNTLAVRRVLAVLGRLDRQQERQREALAIYDKAKAM
jgi:hypothetical protein